MHSMTMGEGRTVTHTPHLCSKPSNTPLLPLEDTGVLLSTLCFVEERRKRR